ncbi:hypothetical protein PRF08_RS23375 [Escherichia coli]|nr:hypothetical protein [Salmonella enterica]EAU9587808.1 hypothetical protein [Salmonella enterica]EDJ0717214.1 hypothetical protein [Salmonella enterica]EIU7313756.1 hypothetical protein [Salmonella enterica subsp. enterica]EKL3666097.1 hypothetical protein [Escherichia coli]
MNDRTRLGFFVGIPLLLAAAGIGLLGALYGSPSDRIKARAELSRAVAEDLRAAYSYNAFIRQAAANAPDAMSNTIAGAWENCALIGFKSIGGQQVPEYRTQHELDVCEASAVQLATSRGHDAAASSQYAQRLRAASAAVRAAN